MQLYRCQGRACKPWAPYVINVSVQYHVLGSMIATSKEEEEENFNSISVYDIQKCSIINFFMYNLSNNKNTPVALWLASYRAVSIICFPMESIQDLFGYQHSTYTTSCLSETDGGWISVSPRSWGLKLVIRTASSPLFSNFSLDAIHAQSNWLSPSNPTAPHSSILVQDLNDKRCETWIEAYIKDFSANWRTRVEGKICAGGVALVCSVLGAGQVRVWALVRWSVDTVELPRYRIVSETELHSTCGECRWSRKLTSPPKGQSNDS